MFPESINIVLNEAEISGKNKDILSEQHKIRVEYLRRCTRSCTTSYLHGRLPCKRANHRSYLCWRCRDFKSICGPQTNFSTPGITSKGSGKMASVVKDESQRVELCANNVHFAKRFILSVRRQNYLQTGRLWCYGYTSTAPLIRRRSTFRNSF